MWKLILLVLILALVSCSGSSGKGKYNEVFVGSYASSCFAAGDGMYLKATISISGGEMTETMFYHNDANADQCEADSMFFKVVKRANISVGADYSAQLNSNVGASYEVDVTYRQVLGYAFDNGTTDYVEHINSGEQTGGCDELGTWQEGVAMDITGTTCAGDGDTQPSAGQKQYGFFSLDTTVSPHDLSIPDFDDDANRDGSAPNKRPIVTHDLGLLRI